MINFINRKKTNRAQLLMFASLLFGLALILQGAKIIATTINAKYLVLNNANSGLAKIKEAQALAAEKDFYRANAQLLLAQKDFASAQQQISSLGAVANSALAFTKKGQTANAVLGAGKSLAQAGIDLDNFYALSSQIKLGADGFSSPDGFYATSNAAKNYLQSGLDNLQIAKFDFSEVDINELPEDQRAGFQDYRGQLNAISDGLAKAADVFSTVQQLVGSGKKTVLVLFENNSEMRATGGFIGTYGLFKIDDGKIVSEQISSIYDLDGQLKEKIAPPGPFHDLTDHWGLRDSNWFADFKLSAQKSSGFYEKIAGETPDTVIAMTPDVFTSLLKVTGPIYFPKYGITLDADNFREEIQLNTSYLYDKQENKPKQMLADFAPLLLQKIASTKGLSYSELLSVMVDNLNAKNILIYDRDASVQNKLENYNWAGEIADTDRDYLAIYNSNLGGKKTDIGISQKLQLQSEVQPDDSVISTLTYTRSLDPNLTDPAKNIDYLRVLVPAGSELISAHGFTAHPYYHSDGSDYNEASAFTVDSDLAAIDAQTSVDAQTSTIITKESGKTEFANWIETSPGQTSTVTIKYRLPFVLKDKKFSLLIQKQPGNAPIDFSYALNSHFPVLWYTPYGLEVSPGTVNYATTLDSDQFIGLVLDK